MSKKPKVFVTGSCGFIGHWLVRGLKEKYFVIGLDNFATGLQEYALECDHFMKKSVLRLIPADFSDVKYVFHLAARARVPMVDKDPFAAHHTNVLGTLTVLDCAKRAGVKKVVYSSSSSVYGDQDFLPMVETMVPNPKNNYGVQKLSAEYYCETWRKTYGLPTVSLRYFNVFGEEQPADNPYTGVITKFIDFKRQGRPLTVYGNGEQTRDFTYVKDVVNANILAVESDIQGIFNIGSGQNYSINQLAQWISDHIEYVPERTGDTLHTRADSSKARRELLWEPTVDLKTWVQNQ